MSIQLFPDAEHFRWDVEFDREEGHYVVVQCPIFGFFRNRSAAQLWANVRNLVYADQLLGYLTPVDPSSVDF